VYRSNKFIYAALIDDEAKKTLCSSSSAKLGLDNPSNCAAATAVGDDLAKKAKALNVSKVVFDRSGYLYHGQVKALADACRKGGLVF
jgi:large subunit ribosomal protein L18